MAGCQPFDVPIGEHVGQTLDTVRRFAASHGGDVSGDSVSGTFSVNTAMGHFRGTYQTREEVVTITITHKPLFVPCSSIESAIRSGKWHPPPG